MEVIDNSAHNLPNFIKQCKYRLKKILEKLEWTEDKVKKNFNSNSIASKSTKKSKEAQPPKKPDYPDSCFNRNNLVLEITQLRELLQDNKVEPPKNFQELQANFSRDQKLKIYQHIIENTQKLESNLGTPVAEGELSLAEIVAQNKREEKRKKRKFRKSKPTYMEEVRYLVELQMQALKQFEDKNEINKSGNKDSNREERNDKRQKPKSRENEKEFRRSSRSHSKEFRKTYRQSHNKDLEIAYRTKQNSQYSHNTHKSRKRSRELNRFNRSYSKELDYKHKRRSRSSSYDRHSRYQRHTEFLSCRSEITGSRSTHCDWYKSRRSRTKSPYKRDTKRRTLPESSKRKRQSMDRGFSPTKDNKRREPAWQNSKTKSSIRCDYDKHFSKNRSYSKQEYLNDYRTKECDYYKKSLEHKYMKQKKRERRRDHS